MKKILYFITFIIAFLVIFTACKKKDKEAKETILTVETKIITWNNDVVRREGVEVYVENNDIGYYKKTDADGKVTFKNIDPGTYEISGEYYDYIENEYYDGELSDPITIKEGDKKTVELILH